MTEAECVLCGATDADGVEVGIARDHRNGGNDEAMCNICLQDGFRNWEFDPSDDQWTVWARRQMDNRPPAEIAPLVNRGLSASEALDYYMVEMGPHSQTTWAEVRGITPQTVSENVAKARKKLEDHA